MPRIEETAHITDSGRRLKLNLSDALEEQVRVVHSVCRRIAMSNGVAESRDGHRGWRTSLNMAGVIRSLTPDLNQSERQKIGALIGQVLRKTGTAACLIRAEPGKPGKNPVWFIADELPQHLVVVAGHVGQRSAAASGSREGFDEKRFLRYGERKLRPEEVGETLPAGEVTVTTTTPNRRRSLNLSEEGRAAKAAAAREVFADRHADARRRHAELVEQLYEFVVTAPVSMSAPEIVTLYNREFGTDWNATTIRTVLKELEDAKRLSSHKETREERLIRGGGEMPKATGPKLYHLIGDSAPRTRLPDGIEPVKSSAAWGREKTERRMANIEAVYAAMDKPDRREAHAPRRVDAIATATGLAEDEVLTALEALVAKERVFYHPKHKYYIPTNRATQRTLDLYGPHARLTPDEAAEAETVHEVLDPTPAPSVLPRQDGTPSFLDLPPDRRRAVAVVVDQVIRLAQDQPVDRQAGADLASLTARVQALEAENHELREKLNLAREIFG